MTQVPVKDKIEYTVAIVSDFAKKYSLSTKLCDPKTGLYFQSPLYVYDYLKTEIKTGKLQWAQVTKNSGKS